MQTEKCLSVLSGAWQWFYNRTFYNECDSLGFKLGTTSDMPNIGLQMQLLTSTEAPAAQRVSVMQSEKCLSVLSDAWQWYYNRTLYNEWNSLGFKLGTTSNLPNLVRNSKYWQAQELQLLNGSLLCKLRNDWVSCQMHDNDSITGLFTMYVTLWASNWGQLPICPILSAIASIGQHRGTGATAAQRVFAVHTEKCLSVLSGAWQWFYNWAFYDVCDSLGFKLGTTSNLPHLWLQSQLLTSTGATAAQRDFAVMPECLVRCMTILL
jgi:hypothetical protein